MPDTPNPDQLHRRPHLPPTSTPYLELNLDRELEVLHREPEWANGQNARTLVKQDALRIVLTALAPGARIAQHRTAGRIAIQTLRGHLRVRAEGRTFDMPVGSLLVLDQNVPHDVESLEDSAFLLTIAWPTSV